MFVFSLKHLVLCLCDKVTNKLVSHERIIDCLRSDVCNVSKVANTSPENAFLARSSVTSRIVQDHRVIDG